MHASLHERMHALVRPHACLGPQPAAPYPLTHCMQLLDRSPIASHFYDSRGVLHKERDGHVMHPCPLHRLLKEAGLSSKEAHALEAFLEVRRSPSGLTDWVCARWHSFAFI